MTRWDSPLFTIVHSDPEPPFEAIWNTLMGDEGQGLTVRPNPSTLAPAPTTASYLAELSKLTQQVLDVIVQQQADRGAGCEVIVSKTASLKLQLPISQVNAGQLQRIRRQFINMNRSHILEMERLEDIFVEYLSKALGTNES